MDGTAPPRAQRFEELIAWQKARALTQRIYECTNEPRFARDVGLSVQLQRSAVSVMSNSAEGFDRASLGEFHPFLATAKASCAEVRSHLCVALDVGYISNDSFEVLRAATDELSRVIGGLLASVQRRRTRANGRKGP